MQVVFSDVVFLGPRGVTEATYNIFYVVLVATGLTGSIH
jgi:hypothetical protein